MQEELKKAPEELKKAPEELNKETSDSNSNIKKIIDVRANVKYVILKVGQTLDYEISDQIQIIYADEFKYETPFYCDKETLENLIKEGLLIISEKNN